jgi:uncharacterized repeat protein (TIGR03803 family)
LHSFSIFGGQTNAGAYPYAGLILAGNTLYGTTYQGGGTDSGTVFAISTNGTGFTTLHSFTGSGNPACSLILSGKTLYGTTADATSFVGGGAVFAVNTDGTCFTNLYYFSLLLTDVTNADGTVPVGGLTLSLNTLYGTAQYGGSSGNGTVFSLSFAPQLAIVPAGANVVLSWPTNVAGFDYTGYALQSTTNLVSPAVWTNISPAPVILNGQNMVTNPISGAQQFYRLIQPTIPPGMALIPAGAFTMGDTLDGLGDAVPISATVSAFYMDTNLVSYSQWQSVYNWATNHGYGFVNVGAGKAANHPVQTVDWYDTVKWCNARSQQAGLTPVYYMDTNLTQIYTNGETDAAFPNWAANGYRLPTEAEWEKAARGGLSGQRFPWGNMISEGQANYYGCTTCYSYDLGPNGYNAAFTSRLILPYTSPVGYFAANGYGLYDMAGNVAVWCWDWYGTPYAGGSDPRGPATGTNRVFRGGDWNFDAYLVFNARCANRNGTFPSVDDFTLGLRCVRGL